MGAPPKRRRPSFTLRALRVPLARDGLRTFCAPAPISAFGLGLPRPYAAYAAGPGSIVLRHDLLIFLVEGLT